ncbi:hypothetical protein L6452_30865 [Arctium lappa]|uniref:Uncharacterized protein n=1 Tax=Arctium lappa TaxID=4217 RepID=A0ACB8ZJH3_ARCLA|nr:hypothetical protein L6452_30865 [Arctium lappa]
MGYWPFRWLILKILSILRYLICAFKTSTFSFDGFSVLMDPLGYNNSTLALLIIICWILTKAGVPHLKWIRVEGEYNVMVINACRYQLIKRVEYMHSRGFLHCDIHQDNFLMGLGPKANQVYIIDYGLAKKYHN